MNYYVGIDVSLEESCICVIDATGKVVREGKISSEPTALIAWLSEVGVTLTRIGLICCGQSYVASAEMSQGSCHFLWLTPQHK
jgi:hypothetical protein